MVGRPARSRTAAQRAAAASHQFTWQVSLTTNRDAPELCLGVLAPGKHKHWRDLGRRQAYLAEHILDRTDLGQELRLDVVLRFLPRVDNDLDDQLLTDSTDAPGSTLAHLRGHQIHEPHGLALDGGDLEIELHCVGGSSSAVMSLGCTSLMEECMSRLRRECPDVIAPIETVRTGQAHIIRAARRRAEPRSKLRLLVMLGYATAAANAAYRSPDSGCSSSQVIAIGRSPTWPR